MPHSTTEFGLPYPDPADPADVPADLASLADRIEELLQGHLSLWTAGDIKFSARSTDHGRWLKMNDRWLSAAEIESALGLASGQAGAIVALLGTGGASKYWVGAGSPGSSVTGKVYLPEARRKMPIGAGPSSDGPGSLSARDLGGQGGAETVTLTGAQSGLPAHSHTASQAAHGHTVIDTGHGHTTTIDAAGGHDHGVGSIAAAAAGSHTHGTGSLATAADGAHSHAPGTMATSTDGVHAHTRDFVREGGSASGTALDSIAPRGPGLGEVGENFNTQNAGSHSHDVTGTTSAAGNHTHALSGATASSGSHTHALSGTTGAVDDHTHTASVGSSTTGITLGTATPSITVNAASAAGAASSHNNLPPFVTLGYAFIRV